MNIVLFTPLYPPDIEPVAVYTKELAKRLSVKHTLTIVAYARLPEKVPKVRMVAINKSASIIVRLFRGTVALWHTARGADIVYAENGASVELPLLFLQLFSKTKTMLHIGDTAGYTWTQKTFFRRIIQQLVMHRATQVVRDMPMPKPEILPFVDNPTSELEAYEASWTAHLAQLENKFHET